MLAHARVMFGIGPGGVGPLTRNLLHDPTLRGFAPPPTGPVPTAYPRRGRIDFAREAEIGGRDGGNGTVRPEKAGPGAGPAAAPGGPAHRADGFSRGAPAKRPARGDRRAGLVLVRARDAAPARQRIAEAAARYELPVPAADRVVPLPGDLALPGLGLSPGRSASWPAVSTSSTTRARR